MALGAASAMNSFPADTLVHVMPQGAAEHDAQQAKAQLKPIGELKPGDKVLAIAEWKDKGQARNDAGDALDARLSYEKVTDVYTSRKEQVLVHLSLDNGEQLTATEGHPFKTSEGWRDAILLKRGGKLLLKGSGEGGSDKAVLIADVRVERNTVQVFNLEVANAHTFFVGGGGALVHNGRSGAPREPVGTPNVFIDVPTRKAAEDLARDMGGIERVDGPHKPGQKPHVHVRDKPGRGHIHICYPRRFGWK
jgi:hypothetical protein